METEVEKVVDSTDPVTVMPVYHLRIKSARIAEDGEWGLQSSNIVYTEIE